MTGALAYSSSTMAQLCLPGVYLILAYGRFPMMLSLSASLTSAGFDNLRSLFGPFFSFKCCFLGCRRLILPVPVVRKRFAVACKVHTAQAHKEYAQTAMFAPPLAQLASSGVLGKQATQLSTTSQAELASLNTAQGQPLDL